MQTSRGKESQENANDSDRNRIMQGDCIVDTQTVSIQASQERRVLQETSTIQMVENGDGFREKGVQELGKELHDDSGRA